MATVVIIRSASPEHNVVDLLRLEEKGKPSAFREVFPNQIAAMLGWLAGTQRTQYSCSAELASEELYQRIEDEFPGGMVQFLEHFPED